MIARRISGISAESVAGRALRLPLRLIPKRTVVTVRSGINAGLRWVAGASVHGCWLGHYEHDKQALVRRLVKPGMKVFDIGANAGFYTLAFSRLVGGAGHVWAFEPFAGNASKLLHHLYLNKIANTTVIQAAVSAQAGVAGLMTDFSDSEWKLSDEARGYLVPTIALDTLLNDGTVPVPNLIKIDVEGAEAQVLNGAREILRSKQTSLLLALHGIEQLNSCMALLAEFEYQVFRLDGSRLAAGCGFTDEIYAIP